MDIYDCVTSSKDFLNLQREVQQDMLAKAALLISKDTTYSYAFAQALSCLLLNNGESIKNENYERVMLGSHPDVKTYPQKDKLLVADSEEIVLESYALPVQADKKIFIIKNFDSSMESAQNKLLKILEEPPKNVYMILTCANINQVLPTIRSRCNKYELAKVDSRVIDDFLVGSENKDIIKSLCDGYLGKAQELEKLKNLSNLFESAVSIITELKTSKQVLIYSKKLIDNKEYFPLFIEILSLALEDILNLKNRKTLRMPFMKDKLTMVEGEYSLKAICEIQNLLNKAVKEQFYNTNVTLIIENLILNILEVKYICK